MLPATRRGAVPSLRRRMGCAAPEESGGDGDGRRLHHAQLAHGNAMAQAYVRASPVPLSKMQLP